MKRRNVAAIAATLSAALIVAGCSKNKGDDGAGDNGQYETRNSLIGTAEDSKGPAPEMPGGRKGGTITFLQNNDFAHLDPAKVYVSTFSATANLIYRPLTTYKETLLPDGSIEMRLVGDLAVDPGKNVKNDCTVWEFTLKDGLKYEDGSPIKAADIAYGVARAFAPEAAAGPHYIQQWLAGDKNYNATYKGPYNGGAKVPPGVTVDGDKKITFTFNSPHCDMPFAAAMTTTAPVPEAKDTKEAYDSVPFSSGPYKIKSHTRGTSMELVRNEHWDPSTDATRHQYPDSFVWKFGSDIVATTNRLKTDEDPNMATYAGVDPAQSAAIWTDPALRKRSIAGSTQFVWYLNINTQRVTDVNVRKALNIAFDKTHYQQLNGGPPAGEIASTVMSPTTAGYKKFDAFGVPPAGDPEKAKTLLGGKSVKLTYAYGNTPVGQQIAAAIKEDLAKAGFDIELVAVDAERYYDVIGDKANKYDFYISGWGADWPLGSTIIPPTLDGREITDQGNYNSAYFDNAEVKTEIDRIMKLPVEQAAPEWAKLDQKIMTDYAPVVPLLYDGAFSLYGSNIGGAYLSKVSGCVNPASLFLKS
ncbi:ABC transporter [Actinorhabdospora filicis]|uniref:ABC transporter n=1 Tax=Actinorhabdospora filicis TaxID=1785913 RepID=A0A9W6SS49_9ACTN|nr:ABC transporter substrate-binding protein [Actinorhabdospora filicis]GLZ81088.1 ABC transporter [Actinorhabdospora filicis]